MADQVAAVVKNMDAQMAQAQAQIDASMVKLDAIAAQIPTIPGQMAAAQAVNNTEQVNSLQQQMEKLGMSLCHTAAEFKQGEELAKVLTTGVEHTMTQLTSHVLKGAADLAPYMTQLKATAMKGEELAAKAKAVHPIAAACLPPSQRAATPATRLLVEPGVAQSAEKVGRDVMAKMLEPAAAAAATAEEANVDATPEEEVSASASASMADQVAAVVKNMDAQMAQAQAQIDASMVKLDAIAAQIPTIPGQMAAAQAVNNTEQVNSLQQQMEKLGMSLCHTAAEFKQGEELAKVLTTGVEHTMTQLTSHVLKGAADLAPYMTQLKATAMKGEELAAKAKAVHPIAAACLPPSQRAASAPTPAPASKLFAMQRPGGPAGSALHLPSALLGAFLAFASMAAAFAALALRRVLHRPKDDRSFELVGQNAV
ncbi:unnamed protein product [Symbiodinium sp. CCMP2592]|nr:unnamed protein product [Symbiodinium sp. CCMP2592]